MKKISHKTEQEMSSQTNKQPNNIPKEFSKNLKSTRISTLFMIYSN